MPDIKKTIARNITELRLLNEMTQAQLGEKLNYSDKTVSKWERGESTPDISVLVALSELFEVPLDALIKDDSLADKAESNQKSQRVYNHRAIVYIVEGSIILAALFAFIITSLIMKKYSFQIIFAKMMRE